MKITDNGIYLSIAYLKYFIVVLDKYNTPDDIKRKILLLFKECLAVTRKTNFYMKFIILLEKDSSLEQYFKDLLTKGIIPTGEHMITTEEHIIRYNDNGIINNKMIIGR